MPSLSSRFPVELGSVRDPDTQVGRLHRLAVAGGPGWGLARLLRRVVQVDAENSAGQTGLFLSALLGHGSAVQLLLAFGADPNHRCRDGSTPVHAGAFSGCGRVMLQLLQAGGDARLHDQQGRTPRDWAEQGGAKQSWEGTEARADQAVPPGPGLGVRSAEQPVATGASNEHTPRGPQGAAASAGRARPHLREQLPHPHGQPPVEGPPRDLAAAEGPWSPARCAAGRPSALQARCRAHGGLSSHAVQLVRPGLAKVGHLEHGRSLHQRWLWPRLQRGYPWGGPGPGLPPPPELYPWLPLELICGDIPATTSDLYSFCILAQEVFTGELPWAGRQGPEVKAKLEAGDSPGLDPLVPAPYQALIQAGLGLRPADRWGSLQSTRYLLREAVAQDSAPEVSCLTKWATLSSALQGCPPEKLYYEVTPRAKTTPRPVPPVMSPGPIPSQALETPEVTGHSRVQSGTAWSSGSSLTLGSSPSHSPRLCPGPSHSPTARAGLHCCPQPSSTAPSTERSGESLFSSLQKMDLLEEITAELQSRCQLRPEPRLGPTAGAESLGVPGTLSADAVPQSLPGVTPHPVPAPKEIKR
nr:inactive serine/threonine-protein kinase TEX14-like isoform X4 [Microcebus murinus]